VLSGSVITVPEKPADDNRGADVWARTLATATALASLVLAFTAVTR
jgi:hypothetical protein